MIGLQRANRADALITPVIGLPVRERRRHSDDTLTVCSLQHSLRLPIGRLMSRFASSPACDLQAYCTRPGPARHGVILGYFGNNRCFPAVCALLLSRSWEYNFVQKRGVARLWEVARFDFLLPRN